MTRFFCSSRVCLLTALLAAFFMVGALSAPTATAHDVLVSSSPDDGAQLDEPPSELVLSFNNELLDLGEDAAAVQITDGDGAEVASGSLEIAGRDATFALPDLQGGDYSAQWSVVSSDGHRIQGTVNFSVEAEAAGATEPSEEATTHPTAEPSAELTSADEQSATGLSLPWIALPIFCVGILAALIATIVRLRRHR